MRQLPHRAGGERAPSLPLLPSPSASTVHILFISLFIALFHCLFTVHPRIKSAGAHPLVDFIGHALRSKDVAILAAAGRIAWSVGPRLQDVRGLMYMHRDV